MKNILISIFLSLIFSCCSNDGWHPVEYPEMEHKVSKWDKNIRYIFSTDISIEERNTTIAKSREYIKDNLWIIKESELKDSIEVIFVEDKEDMYNYTYLHVSGTVFLASDKVNNLVFCVYGTRHPLKHELMHIISLLKWGRYRGEFTWLSEGLATYADPMFECDNYSFEEKYTAFLQKGKLIPIDSLMADFHGNIFAKDFDNNKNKLRYNQSAYMVQYMIENYGSEKIKALWQSEGMEYFEQIFGIKVEDMINNIERHLKAKYPNLIPFDWEEFQKKCY